MHILELLRQRREAELRQLADSKPKEQKAILQPIEDTNTSKVVSLNTAQLRAKNLAFEGKNFCLVGAAGTGKTTAQKEVARALLNTGVLGTHDFKMRSSAERVEAPSIAFVAFTRIAAGNLQRIIHSDPELADKLPVNITTIHNLLEYAPEEIEYIDSEGNLKTSLRFKPGRHASNKLKITHLIIEEASMVDLTLWNNLFDAMQENTKVIFIGDINQLPPVMGDSVLCYALTRLPVVELTQVYRQAKDSGILENAHNILEGKMVEEYPDFKIMEGRNVADGPATMAAAYGKLFPSLYAKDKYYDPEKDMILSPWNKHELGTINMNKWIAQFLGEERGAEVHEILAGRHIHYLAIGDRVMYEKKIGIIEAIMPNSKYLGPSPKMASPILSRFGMYVPKKGDKDKIVEDFLNDDRYAHLDLDALLDSGEELEKIASHSVRIRMLGTEEDLSDSYTETLQSIGDFAPIKFCLAYALTVHKAQGCEWRKVFFILHKSHAVSLTREMLYTGVTRAREQCIMLSKKDTILRAISQQRVVGDSVEEKIANFNAKVSLNEEVQLVK